MYYMCFDKAEKIEFESAGRFVTDDTSAHPKRILKSAVILLGYSGECALAQDNREYVLKKGTFQILFPETVHEGTRPVTKDQSHFWCHFHLPDGFYIKEADNSAELIDEGICVLPEFSCIGDFEKYFILFSQMIDESEKNSGEYKFSSDICDAYIRLILLSLADYCENQSAPKSGKAADISKIKEWIRIHACDGIGVKEAAEKLGYNSDYLTQLIKSDTAMTTSAYINSLRLKNAKSLLLSSTLSVSEIAYLSGFNDVKYFMRIFRKKENMTPTQYKNAHGRSHINKR